MAGELQGVSAARENRRASPSATRWRRSPRPAHARVKTDRCAVTISVVRNFLPNRLPEPIRSDKARPTSCVWETDYFEPNWQDAFWGGNYPWLRAIKQKYDPEGLFFLHHGVGSEDWSADGFMRMN
jgi:hypothetical protein